MLNPTGIDARLSAVILFLWPTLFAIPQLVGGEGSRLLLIGVAAIALAYLVAFARRPNPYGHPRASVRSVLLGLLLPFFLSLLLIAIYRAPELYLPAQTKIGISASIVILSTIMFFSFEDVENVDLIDLRLRALLCAAPLLVTILIVVRLLIGPTEAEAEIEMTNQTYNAILSRIGLQIPRLGNLPGISGANGIGNVAAISLIAVLHLWRTGVMSRRRGLLRTLYAGMAAANIVALILCEGRAAIAWLALGSAAYLWVSPKLTSRIGQALLVFLIASPIILYGFFDWASRSSAFSILVRSGQGEQLGVGTGRQFIWKEILSYLSRPQYSDLFGYGYVGHYQIGVEQKAQWIFGKYTENVLSTHNAILQITLDNGYIGLVAFSAICWLALDSIGRSAVLSEANSRCILSIFLLMIGTSMTEVTLTMYQLIPFLLFAAILALSWSLARYDGLRFVWDRDGTATPETNSAGWARPQPIWPSATRLLIGTVA